jgi:two-component system, response regulator
MGSKVILLVEDNPDDEAMTLFALEKNHIANDVIVARDGAEALDFLFATGKYADRDMSILPDLILMDLKLPKIDGIEVLRQLRQDPRTHLLPVVMLTTSDEKQDRLKSYELCVNSFIRKPVDFERFVEIVRYIGLYWLVINEAPISRN